MSVEPVSVLYPVRFDVEYPTIPRNRLTVFFRLILIIPILIVFGLVAGGNGGTAGWNAGARDPDRFEDRGAFRSPDRFDRDLTDAERNTIVGVVVGTVGAVLVFLPATIAAAIGLGAVSAPLAAPVALMLVFRQKYPRWWYDFSLQVARFGGRVGAYAALQRDEYPSTDEEQAVRLEIDYPDAQALNRWLPLVKWFLAIPHGIVLFFLFIGLVVTTLIAWIAILVTGNYPRGLFDYAVGVARWAVRVSGYAFFLVTDRYPPFSLR